MPNINPIHLTQADTATAATLNAVKASLGVIPNMFLTLAHSPVALNGYMQLSGVTSKGTFNAKLREQIALAVGEKNSCEYCVTAHSVIGDMVGLKANEIAAARNAQSGDARETAILSLAVLITEQRGHLSAAEISSYKAQGLSDADILEVLTNVVLNMLTNYTNHIAATDIDFPRVEWKKTA